MGRLVTVVLLLACGPLARAQEASPVERLEGLNRELGGALHPVLRRSGRLRAGGSAMVRTRHEAGCQTAMVAVEPRDAPLGVRFASAGDSANGSPAGDGIWEAQICTAGPGSARVRIRSERAARWALWLLPAGAMIGALATSLGAPAPSPAESALDTAVAGTPRFRTSVRLAEIEAEGGLSVDRVRRVISLNPPGLLDCWRDPVERDPTLAGDRSAAWVVAPDGRILSVHVEGGAQDGARANCSREALGRPRFPAAPDGRSTRIRAVLRVQAVQIAP